MILRALGQLVADADPTDPLSAWPWVGSILTPLAVAAGAFKLYRDERAERIKAQADKDAMTKVMVDEWVPLMTRNLDLLNKLDERMVATNVSVRRPRT